VADVLFPLALACAAELPEVIPVGRLRPTRPADPPLSRELG